MWIFESLWNIIIKLALQRKRIQFLIKFGIWKTIIYFLRNSLQYIVPFQVNDIICYWTWFLQKYFWKWVEAIKKTFIKLQTFQWNNEKIYYISNFVRIQIRFKWGFKFAIFSKSIFQIVFFKYFDLQNIKRILTKDKIKRTDFLQKKILKILKSWKKELFKIWISFWKSSVINK